MEFYKNVAVLAFSIVIIYGSNAISIKCGNPNNCFCTKNIYDVVFQCPSDGNDSLISITVGTHTDVVRVHCKGKLNWHTQDLPPLEIEAVDYFKFRTCPFPSNFAEIISRLKVNSTKRLMFDHSVDFANGTLTADHFKGLHNLERLILNYDDIKDIDEDAFQLLDKLIELNLDRNKIRVTDGLFKNLSKLKLLNLGDNAIPHLPADIFQNLTDLKYLYFWANNLATVNSSTFRYLKNLELLDLSRNQLEYLPENIFNHLENLKTIDMSTNKLQNIPEDLFRRNKLLKVVLMDRNPNITYLPNNLFSNLTKLEKVFLRQCKISKLPDNLFEGSINLQSIYLQSNELDEISENVFKGLKNLQQLNLSYNKIRDWSAEVFSMLLQLKNLNLQNNLLTKITAEHFSNLESLEILNLRNNQIRSIETASFRRVHKLKDIILANNYLDFPKNVSLFINNFDLRTVDLSNNNITVMSDFTTFTKLRNLDFSYNQISYLNFNEVLTVASPIHINLKHNNITTVHFDKFEVTAESQGNPEIAIRVVSLNENPIECNCHLYDFVTYLDRSEDVPMLVTIEADNLTCSSPNDFLNVSVTKLKPNMLTCSLEEWGIEGEFTDKCSYRFRPWDTSLIVNCTNSNFTEAPELILPTQNFFNQTEMHLQGNLLTSAPEENMGYQNVTKLFLSSNKINEITWIPPKLKVLELDNNNITYLNDEILAKLNSSYLTNITLGNNAWNCDCSTVNVLSFLLSKLATKQLQIDANTITCRDSGKALINLTSDDMCPSNMALVLGLGITFSLIALTIAVVMALYYRFQHEVKVWLFAHKMFLWFVTEDESDKEKLYDAFLSYSHKDEEFVLNELLPVLEQGPHPYKICVHIRDFIAGKLIFKQIVASVAESRRTLVVLSHNFLDSEWGKLEFRTAHKQALNEGRARVILILYGNIDINSDLDDELRAYVRTNTYVKWGDPWFWDKLRYALPHLHRKVDKVSQKTENITIAMTEKLDKGDDKFDLINGASSTSNPGSTPPINQLLLSNNPLKFPQPNVNFTS